MIQAMVKKLNGKRLRQRIFICNFNSCNIGKFFWYSWRSCYVSNGCPVQSRINQLWFFAG